MTGNRSLDEFAAGEDGDDAAAPVEGASGAPESRSAGTAPEDADAATTTDGPDDPAVEPIAETFAWSADGGPCDQCGESVETRWRDGDRLVCEGCKTW